MALPRYFALELLAFCFLMASTAFGQQVAMPVLGSATHVIVPQARCFALPGWQQGIVIEDIRASVNIVEQTARTTLEIALVNRSGRQEQAVLLLPVPDGAVVSGFDFQGSASEPTARVMTAEEARRIYDGLVSQIKDPALLEFAGYRMVRSSVFPVPALGTQKIRLTYEHLLERDNDRIDYVLPRSESLERPRSWDVTVRIQSTQPIATVYSPSHQIQQQRSADGTLTVAVHEQAKSEPGPFRLSMLMEGNGLSASLMAYPDPSIGGGYFLLMAGLPARLDLGDRMKREVTIVLDRSGSMAGPKMDQVRAAALQVIEGLDDGEAFNIIDYATTVSKFSAAPTTKNRSNTLEARKYLATLRPTGGTNIHDALLEALRQPCSEDMLPIVLFLTDGLPTIGRTGEVAIRDMVEHGNPHERRIFTFGVGEDVNVPLLDRLATSTRAVSAYVLPGEDIELAVAGVFRRLHGPVFSSPTLTVTDSSGAITTRRVHDLIPDPLPDLFDGDQLILLGKYRDEGPIGFQLTGDYLGVQRTFNYTFDLAGATTKNAFVSRLWASRRIAFLIDQVRQAGASSTPIVAGQTVLNDPQLRELVEEIVRLSTKFGILTEYTAFLATEGTDLTDWSGNLIGCSNELDRRAVRSRSGRAAVAGAWNLIGRGQQQTLLYNNYYVNENLNAVTFTSVQQINDRAFFRRGTRWIDSSLLDGSMQPDVVIMIGSPEHLELLRELIRQNRQGVLSLPGEILLKVGDRVILVQNSGC